MDLSRSGTAQLGSSMPGDVIEDDMVLFAVPKKGRLNEEVMKLLKGSGLDANRPDRLDVAICKELPVKLVFLPAADIPSYVMEGNIDIGITGSDVLEEALIESGQYDKPNVKVLKNLGFGKCKLCVQAPVKLEAKDAKMFAGKRIVTSFPALSKRFFDGLGVEGCDKTSIKVVSGSVEAACGLGLADAIVDLVETGTTMKAAGLEVVAEVFQAEALMFQQLPTETNGLKGKKGDVVNIIKDRIEGYLTSTRYVMVVYNCHKDDLPRCCEITPGKRSPTITPLKEEGWQSVSALIEKQKHNAIMDELTKVGAKDILCFSLTNTRM